MNVGPDDSQALSEHAEKLKVLTEQKNERLTALTVEHEELPKYLGQLNTVFQGQFNTRYIERIKQDLADIDQKHDETLRRPPALDLVSKRTDPSVAQEYRDLKAFKQAISSRQNYPEWLKTRYEGAVQNVLDAMAPSVQRGASDSLVESDELQPLLGDSSSFNEKATSNTTFDPMTNAFVEEIHSLQSVADRRAPENMHREADEVRRDILDVDTECDEIYKYLNQETKKYKARLDDLVGRLDVAHATLLAGMSGKITAGQRKELGVGVDRVKSDVLADSTRFKDAMSAPMSQLRTMYLSLALRQTFMTEMISQKKQMPSFELLRDHQIKQQQYLKQVIQITKRLIKEDEEVRKLEQRHRSSPDVKTIQERLKDRSELLIKLQHIQEMQSLQQQRLCAICGSREQAQSGPSLTKDATPSQSPKISNAAFAIVPLLVAKSMNMSEAPEVRYDDPASGRVNKPNLTATTMFHDEAHGQSFLLASGAPGVTSRGPRYQVITLNNLNLLQGIDAAEFGAPVEGKITKDTVKLENGNVKKTTLGKTNEGPSR